MMQTQTTLVLVGMPGSGKSSVGRLLARELELPFADLDTLLEAEEGCSIAQIFEQRGEGYFRHRESQTLQQVLHSTVPLVLATGGGTPCYFDNMEQIRRQAFSIYLEVGWQELADRLSQQPGQRPLLAGLGHQASYVEELQEKFSWRIPFYRQAHVHIRLQEGVPVQEVVQQILQRLQQR
ncbi:shikimate kinase [Cesiribacter andamanensis]|uniref:Shikimate kinase n=1 Tax=Cesiribacter andamanensis AMV16 TaxID=1279009 RepID=M7P1N3_9BACT|nr:shikimate kinase [Cesiribacter andamanensis]EMR04519.1 Shikimate kinase [Cesiribacter andamanensis AMV16]